MHIKIKNVNEDTQKMQQLRNTALPRYQKKELQLKTTQTPHVSPQTHKQRKIATEEPLSNVEYENYCCHIKSLNNSIF